jgi:hypothetical protein
VTNQRHCLEDNDERWTEGVTFKGESHHVHIGNRMCEYHYWYGLIVNLAFVPDMLDVSMYTQDYVGSLYRVWPAVSHRSFH